MRQRHIGRFARRDGQRHADQMALHRIKPIGLGINGDKAGFISPRNPIGQRGGIANAEIALCVQRAHLGRQGTIARIRFTSRSGLWRRRIICRQRVIGGVIIDRPAIPFGQPFGQRVKFHRFGKADKLAAIGHAQRHITKADRHGRVAFQCHQFAADTRLLGKFNQIFAAFILLNLSGARQ